jgi:type IV pilus assembly protein PilX
MSRTRIKNLRHAPPRRQRGVVLLIALIVLVVMTLAGIGMMRSVDTGTVVAGNLAFRQSTMQAADLGINTAYNSLVTAENSITDRVALNYSDQTGTCSGVSALHCSGGVYVFPGYSASVANACEITGTCPSSQTTWWAQDATWGINGTPAPSVAPVVKYMVDYRGTGVINVKDAIYPNDPGDSGNQDKLIATVRYVIHRMCTADGTSGSGNLCQTFVAPGVPSGGSQSVGGLPFTTSLVFYRITVRSEGPRNSVSYSQSMVLMP